MLTLDDTLTTQTKTGADVALSSAYVQAITRVPELFRQIQDAQVPESVTQQLLKDWGFTSSADRAFLPLLKSLGFLTPDGKTTNQYKDYRDNSRSKGVMADALRDAYSEVFLIKSNPTTSDSSAITGKFKSYHSTSDNVAGLMTKTFFSLLALADLGQVNKPPVIQQDVSESASNGNGEALADRPLSGPPAGLHYNIQVHLPATKDVEVYNAIFKSLKEHLF